MQKLAFKCFKGFRYLKSKALNVIDKVLTYIILYVNGIEFSSFVSKGYPVVNVSIGGRCNIGKNFRMNNRVLSNPIGRFNRCSIIVGPKGNLRIGNNVGMSSVAIVCEDRVIIGDNVKIGGNVVVYDTDFHSLDSSDRLVKQNDGLNTNRAQVIISDNVFIGAHTTVLKGVVIGENSIIGACSVVTKNVPPNEIWAGNPAKKLRNI